RIERRIDEIETLKRKYGQSVEDVLAYEARARRRLASVDGREAELLRLSEAVDRAAASVAKTGGALSAKRAKAAPALAKEISAHLQDLGFHRSSFEIEVEALPEPGPRGCEGVDFLFG